MCRALLPRTRAIVKLRGAVECGGDRAPRRHQALRGHPGPRRGLAHVSARCHPRAPGLERVGQVHPAAPHPGPGRARRGHGPRSTGCVDAGSRDRLLARMGYVVQDGGLFPTSPRRQRDAWPRTRSGWARGRGSPRGSASWPRWPGSTVTPLAPLPPRAERGPAPAGGPDAGAHARSAGAPARRAARRARSDRARRAAGSARARSSPRSPRRWCWSPTTSARRRGSAGPSPS